MSILYSKINLSPFFYTGHDLNGIRVDEEQAVYYGL
jgi:hypothetical protein